jgi:hypothetical protein
VSADELSHMRFLGRRYGKRTAPTPGAIADIIERFVTDRSKDPWEWDDFVSVSIPDARLEAIRRRCAGLRDEFPPHVATQYCGPGGIAVLQSLLRELRGSSGQSDG